MKLEIFPGSENYTAVVVRVPFLRKHSNADRLQCTTILGNNVITGLETKENELYLYFPPESQLSSSYAVNNDLIRRKDENGKAAGGMLETHRRIRVLKLRGEPSAGLLMPLKSLDILIGIDYQKLQEGDEFNAIDNIEICRKYVATTKQIAVREPKERAKGKKQTFSKVIAEQFHFHYSTSQLAKSITGFCDQDLVVITQKLHGTSLVLSNVLCHKQLSWKEKVAKWFGVPVSTRTHDTLYASRTVVKNAKETLDPGGWYKEDVWGETYKKYKYALEKGVTLYCEIVGYLPSGGFIQKGYVYGCAPGTSQMYVYRITLTNEDGVVTEMSWQQIKNYCAKYNLNYVPELYYGKLAHLMPTSPTQHFHEELLTYLRKTFLEKTLPEGVPDEGICIRNESKDFVAYKYKDFAFLGYETAQLDAGEVSVEDTGVSEEVAIEE